jgi:hypothetical protein
MRDTASGSIPIDRPRRQRSPAPGSRLDEGWAQLVPRFRKRPCPGMRWRGRSTCRASVAIQSLALVGVDPAQHARRKQPLEEPAHTAAPCQHVWIRTRQPGPRGDDEARHGPGELIRPGEHAARFRLVDPHASGAVRSAAGRRSDSPRREPTAVAS